MKTDEKKQHISELLEKFSIEKTAKILGVSIPTLYRRMKEIGLEKIGKKGRVGRKIKNLKY